MKHPEIGKNVRIAPNAVIHDNVIIGDDTIIEDFCVIGYPAKNTSGPLIIGANSHIRTHSVLYEGSYFDYRLVTGHSVLIRENTIAGRYLQVGSNSDIEGDCEFGNYVKIHTDVHVSKHAKIHNLVWLFPRVQFTNDPFPPSQYCEGIEVHDLAVISTGALLLPGITIGLASFIAAGSLVRSSVPDLTCVSGNPAKKIATIDRFHNYKYKLSLPWPKHFREGYPEESFPMMDELLEKVNNLKQTL
ncbi:MAG: acyltransferase [Bacteroidota bacterium]